MVVIGSTYWIKPKPRSFVVFLSFSMHNQAVSQYRSVNQAKAMQTAIADSGQAFGFELRSLLKHLIRKQKIMISHVK